MRRPDNVLRHELIGLECEVVAAVNKSSVGIRGTIKDETMKTIQVGSKIIFKKGSVFRLALNGKKIDVEGDQLLARPEDRIKKKVRRW